MGFVSHFVLPLRTFSRVVMAMMVRFSFRAIEGVSIFEFSSAKSCASSAGKHALAAPSRGAAGYLTTAAEESQQLASTAALATILNHIAAFRVGDAFLNLHCLFANNAAQQIDQRAFIVIQMRIFRNPSHFQPFISPSPSARLMTAKAPTKRPVSATSPTRRMRLG
jgi:hypothetical protein